MLKVWSDWVVVFVCEWIVSLQQRFPTTLQTTAGKRHGPMQPSSGPLHDVIPLCSGVQTHIFLSSPLWSSTLPAPYFGFMTLTMWLFHRNFTSFTSPTSLSASSITSYFLPAVRVPLESREDTSQCRTKSTQCLCVLALSRKSSHQSTYVVCFSVIQTSRRDSFT